MRTLQLNIIICTKFPSFVSGDDGSCYSSSNETNVYVLCASDTINCNILIHRFVGFFVCCRIKANSSLMGPGPADGVSSVGVFLKDTSPY